ncbi:MAG: hypothetical protein K0B37_00795 [Bacteroidales bacterium]|nr:hypothetical protein [Bacteroidales bacterium]
MMPDFKKRIDAFIELGKQLNRIALAGSPDQLSPAGQALFHEILESPHRNPWFTAENVKNAITGLSVMLEENKMRKWLKDYTIQDHPNPSKVAVVMAGNIPGVGFHDFMCVLVSGNHFLGKLSGQDNELPVKIASLLTEIEQGFSTMIEFTDERISDFDAVIATGSNNTSRYFEYYFGKYPHIIRRNRNSIAILDGYETPGEQEALSNDIFMFYGMGCRSVSLIFIPDGYEPELLLDSFSKWEHLKNHHKFYNNYEYQKAIFLVNRTNHLDTGFVLLKEDISLRSPLAVLHYYRYKSMADVQDFIVQQKENIQCVVARQGLQLKGAEKVNTGDAQNPGPSDYADGIDTLKFLLELNARK